MNFGACVRACVCVCVCLRACVCVCVCILVCFMDVLSMSIPADVKVSLFHTAARPIGLYTPTEGQ